MELLIGLLLVGLVGIVAVAFKFLTDDDAQQKRIEDVKSKKIADMEAEAARKDMELKKTAAEFKRMEEDYYKAKDEADVQRKDNTELLAKIKALEKAKDEFTESKNDSKQKDMLLQQETVARQKLQAELSLCDTEIEKKTQEIDALKNDVERLKQELKNKTEMFDGLKGQYAELDNEIQRVRMEQASKTKEEAPKPPEPIKSAGVIPVVIPVKETPAVQKPAEPPLAPAVPKAEPVQPPVKPVEPPAPAAIVKPAFLSKAPEPLPAVPLEKKPVDLPGSPKDVPSDTDFLKAQPPSKPADMVADIPDGAFKFTNVNKPSAEAPGEPKKEKKNPKKETLVPGFHPKDKTPPGTHESA